MSLPYLADQMSKICLTNASKKKLKENKLKLYKNLKNHEIVEELHERNITFNCNSETKVLQNLLDIEMHGIRRLPALFFDNPQKTLKEVGLEMYEVLNNELLHDIPHHTQNLYDELPKHLPKKMIKQFKQIIYVSFNGKDAKNFSDYRESLLMVCTWLMQISNRTILQLKYY